MKSYLKIFLIILFSVGITIFISPIIASLIPFHLYKIAGRTFLVVSFFLFYYFKENLGFSSIEALGVNLIKWGWWRNVSIGFLLGVISLGLICAMMIHSSIRFVIPDISLIHCWKILSYLIVGVIVALIEETFLRGFILQGLLRDTNVVGAFLFTNILYSIAHFLKPEVLPDIEVLGLSSSINGVPFFFETLVTKWPLIWPQALGLFLAGMVLSMAYIKTRSLALGIGLHAGWILCVKSLSMCTDVTVKGGFWLSGDVLSNPMGWIMLVLLLFGFSLRKGR